MARDKHIPPRARRKALSVGRWLNEARSLESFLPEDLRGPAAVAPPSEVTRVVNELLSSNVVTLLNTQMRQREAIRNLPLLLMYRDRRERKLRQAERAVKKAKAGEPETLFRLIELHGMWLLNNSPAVGRLAEAWQGQAIAGDPDAREKWKAFCTALSILPPGRVKLSREAIRAIRTAYDKEHRFCKALKAAVRRRYRNPAERDRSLMKDFNLTREELQATLAEAQGLKPSEWARVRVARSLHMSPETVRRALLRKTRELV